MSDFSARCFPAGRAGHHGRRRAPPGCHRGHVVKQHRSFGHPAHCAVSLRLDPRLGRAVWTPLCHTDPANRFRALQRRGHSAPHQSYCHIHPHDNAAASGRRYPTPQQHAHPADRYALTQRYATPAHRHTGGLLSLPHAILPHLDADVYPDGNFHRDAYRHPICDRDAYCHPNPICH